MQFTTNKEKGRVGLSVAIAYYGMLGYTVSLPLNDTQGYDLIVDNQGILHKVQVKATGSLGKSTTENSYVVDARSTGGTKGGVHSLFRDEDFDLLFVFTEDRGVWEIPKTVINNYKSALVVRRTKNVYGKKDSLDTSEFYKGQFGL